ncbi:DUF4350 domain-containing protein [Arthrobacter livingstonensis]|uniref:DUF4350 domain-containing protein n=1 Tax=Arthrobacter livingstonensis TaxID=670078 RepID=A0A2V5LF27_9MICC|nr:DUF4350 domain-containing protein [Arthrobacter livingstonensis]PYI69274.1 DUF4350 domain-containing protein [Arthrobacter livingstonensis]
MSSAPVRSEADVHVFRADGGTRAERAGFWWRRSKFWLLAGAALVAVTVAGLVVGNIGGRSGEPLSMTNPAPEGGQAVATVLRERGVEVTSSDSLEATLHALAANGRGASTVLVYDPLALLQPGQASRLAGSAAEAGAKLVALAPGPLATKHLNPELSSAGTASNTDMPASADCASPAAQAAGTIDATGVDGLGVGASPSLQVYRGAVTCFAPAGSTAGFMAANSTGDVTVLGNPGIVSNERLASRGNAALTFRLLGSRPHLVWYTASLKDVTAASHPPTLAELTPAWIFPASGWLLLAAVIGMLWRGRRHGPLVTEPLPVIVKASETVTGRARLYQDANAQDTAVHILQHATLTRLAQHLRLGTQADPAAVVEAAAARTGRTRRDLEALLVTDVPLNDKQMLTMAAELAALEEEVAQR